MRYGLTRKEAQKRLDYRIQKICLEINYGEKMSVLDLKPLRS